MFSRILVAFDGSDHAKRCLTDAVDLARAGDGKLTVLSVSLPVAAWVNEAGLAPPLDMGGVQQQVDDIFWTELNEAGGMIPAEVQSTSTLRVGDPAEEILDQVRTGEHDLVVIGSRGRGAVKTESLGRVSRHVSQSCPVPVLIVHGKVGTPPEIDAPGDQTISQNGDRLLRGVAQL